MCYFAKLIKDFECKYVKEFNKMYMKPEPSHLVELSKIKTCSTVETFQGPS